MFGFGFDKRAIMMFMIIMAALTILGDGTNGILATILSIPGILIAITFHEFAHAFAADRLGDGTPRAQGRLNLNPISHIDPIGLIFLLVAGFGWGKPVEINPAGFNRKRSMTANEAIVSVAGPLMNFILAFIVFIIYYGLFEVANIAGNWADGTRIYTQIIVGNIILINISLGVFNLLPIPPLDGSKILKLFLPYRAKQWFENNESMFYLVFLLIWLLPGVLSTIVNPIFDIVYTGMAIAVQSIFGIFI